jgi:hypothetical protein
MKNKYRISDKEITFLNSTLIQNVSQRRGIEFPTAIGGNLNENSSS